MKFRSMHLRSLRYLCLGTTALLFSGAVSGCIFGNTKATVTISTSDSSGTQSTQRFSYQNPNIVLTVNLPAELIIPNSLDRAVDSYSIVPDLPSGLELNSLTGIISGTPAVISPSISYIVTAFTTSGILTAPLSIRINDIPPELSFLNGATFTRGRAINNVAPTNSGGAVISCTVTPTLPSGVHLSSSCVLSGTPLAASSTTLYSFTATNSGGSRVTTSSITVLDSAPAFTYTGSPAVFTKNQPITPRTPVRTGGTIESCSVTPSLPAGLTLSQACVISGTPTIISSATNYTITGTNSAGSGTAFFNIVVYDIAPSSLSYSSNPAIYTLGSSISDNTPSSGGGAISHYSISPPLPTGLSLNSSTGVISGTPAALITSTPFTVTGTNLGGFIQGTVTITVKDVAPSNLTYSGSTSAYSLGAAIPPNTPSSTGGTVTNYTVSPALPAGLSIHPATGIISGIPTAVASSASYTVTATNSGGSTQATLTLTVKDHPPSNLNYSDSAAVYTKNLAISANTPSSLGGAVTSYSVSPSLPTGLSLNPSTGVITGTPTTATAAASYTVTATNSGGSTQTNLSLLVTDQAQTDLTYSSNPALYVKGSAISANTPSFTGGAAESYSISPTLPSGLSLNTLTGVITGTPTVTAASDFYTVTATYTGGTSQLTLSLTVKDVAPSNLSYSQDPAVYTKGSAITANTPSSMGGTITNYTVSPALPAGLTIDSSTGVISGSPTSVAPSASYTVTASNSGGSTQAIIHLAVNDIAPSNLSYSHNPVAYTRGSAISSNNPSSMGGAVISYTVSPALPEGLSIHAATGVITGTPIAIAADTSYTVTATNSGGSTTTSLALSVKDVAPSNLSFSNPTAFYTKGSPISPNIPSQEGGSVTHYSITPALPAGLSLNSTSGIVSGTPTVVAAAATYTVTATNSGGSTQATLNITVNEEVPSNLVYTDDPIDYTIGVPIPTNTPSSDGGEVESYAISPPLPTGLALNTLTGVISGTPTVISPTQVYAVTATNSGGSQTSSLTLAVNDVAPSNLHYSSMPALYTLGTPITDNSPSLSGGTVISYSISPALPEGLAFNSTTGVISGTPTALKSSTTYTITATNSGGSTTTSLPLRVNVAAPSTLSYSTNPASYTVGSAITNNTPTSSGGAVVSYSVSPVLPAGLSLNTSTGVISGTPTTVTSSTTYTVTAMNSEGSTTTPLTLTVNGISSLSLTYSSNPVVYTKDSPISDNTPSPDGTVTSYSISPSLPAGLALDTTTGVISGTPSAVSAMATYLITATGPGGSAQFNLTLTVNDIPPSDLTYSLNPATYTKNSIITDNTPSSTGGAVVLYSVFPNLPAGLSLNTLSGVISGIATTLSATTTYTVTATNSGGSTLGALDITVNDVAPSNLAYSTNPASYSTGTSYSNTPTSQGGAVTSYSISPTLPSGLSLNTSTGVISGTPTAASSTTPYTITASNSGGSTQANLSITVIGSAAKLGFISSPASQTYISQTNFNPALTVAVQDTNSGTVTTASNSVTIALVSNTTSGTLSGTLTQSAVNGIATFNDIKLNKVGSYTLSATSSGLTATPTTGAFSVTAAAPSQMIFSAGSTSSSAGACTGPYQLTLQDSSGNTATNSSGSTINISLSQTGSASFYGTSGCNAGTLSQVSVTSGQSTSGQFYLKDSTGETITLTANGTAAGLGTKTFSVTVIGSASKLAFVSSPAGQSYVSQSNFSPALTVAVQDSNGLTVTTSSASVTIALVSNTTSGTLSGTLTQSAVNGIATFNDIKLNKVGSYTLSATSSGLTATPTTTAFSVTAAAASQMIFSAGSTSSATGSCAGPYQLTLQDSSGNTATNSSGSTINISLSQTGSASFYGTSGCNAGTLSQVSVTSGQSTSSQFYLKDSTGETITLTANGTAAGLGTKTFSVTLTSSATTITGNPRSWSDGTYAASCNSYLNPTAPYSYAGSTGSGVYSIKPSGVASPFAVYCDMTADGGGWTLAAIPNIDKDIFAEDSTTLQDPTATSGQRNQNIWSSTNTTFSFDSLRLTDGSSQSNVAKFSQVYTLSSLLASKPNYSQNAVVATTSVTSTISSSCFILRGMSADTTPFDDSADYMLMGFMGTSGCVTPLEQGDYWDADNSTGTWCVGCNDKGDPLLSQSSGSSNYKHGVGRPTNPNDHWFGDTYANVNSRTLVWLKNTITQPAPSNLTYSANPASYSVGSAIASNTPSYTGNVSSFSISPSNLPAGLSFNTLTGVITGTPTTPTASSSYTVTAINPAGQTQVTLSISVQGSPSQLIFSSGVTSTSINSCAGPYQLTVQDSVGNAITNSGATWNISLSSSGSASFYGTSGCNAGTLSQVSVSVGQSTSSQFYVKDAVAENIILTANGSSFGTGTKTFNLSVVQPPANLTYSTNPATYSRNTAISPNNPTSSGGAVVSYAVSPALPTGLSINTSTGIISGTPVAPTAASSYTVTATNSAGTAQVTLTITVNEIAPSNLTYAANPVTYQKDVAISNNTPTNGGGTTTSYSVSPPLPQGLSLNTSTGVISGTPTTTSSASNYTVTAYNSIGSTTAVVNITVSLLIPGQTNAWAWISGQSVTNQIANFGIQGVASSSNFPGGRFLPRTWTTANGNFWLFGGTGPVAGQTSALLNDLWKWNGTNWTWVTGSTLGGQSSTYGVKGVAASMNIPGGRDGATSGTDSSGNLWLFGGWGYMDFDAGSLDDLWRWDGTNWTFISGSSTAANVTPSWGTKGTASPSNKPGSRYYAASWVDSSNNFWLFGGYDHSDTILNDLWKWDGTNWTWISGSNSQSSGNYGTKNVIAASNVPGSRTLPAYWKDASGNFWLFGGSAPLGYLNDLWKWNGTNWVWIAGDSTISSNGSYGVKGVASTSNLPLARDSSAGWVDSTGNTWIFGGASGDGYLNDLWKWDGTNWTWISGLSAGDRVGSYGTIGIASTSNYPGSRIGSGSWIDSSGNFWIMGGHGYGASTSRGYLNDLWKFTY